MNFNRALVPQSDICTKEQTWLEPGMIRGGGLKFNSALASQFASCTKEQTWLEPGMIRASFCVFFSQPRLESVY